MNIELHPKLEQFLEQIVRRGDYANVSAATTEAVQLLEKRDRLVKEGGGMLFANLGAFADADIMGLAFIVMMEAAKSAQEDLKAIMAQVKAINAAKSEMRGILRRVAHDVMENLGRTTLTFASAGVGSEEAYHSIPLPHPDADAPDGIRRVPTDLFPAKLTRPEHLVSVQETLKHALDSLSEMGEMESLRLQMAMDRASKMMSTLSNVLKQLSDTGQAIAANIK